jgi:hypothetical protein
MVSSQSQNSWTMLMGGSEARHDHFRDDHGGDGRSAGVLNAGGNVLNSLSMNA